MRVECPTYTNTEILSCIQSNMRNFSRVSNTEIFKLVWVLYNTYDYLGSVNDLDKLIPLNISDEEKEIWINLYTNHLSRKNKPARRYYSEIMSYARNNLCPLCQLEAVSELDHYMPKSIFPEFSIYHKNLIPICHTCNNLKETNNDIIFPHLYYEDIDGEELLKVYMVSRNGTIVWKFYVEDSLSDLGISYKNMFDYLSLGEKYEVKAIDEFCSLHQTILSIYHISITKELRKEFLGNLFEREIIRFETEYGLNHWRTALYKAFLNNIDYLLNDIDVSL